MAQEKAPIGADVKFLVDISSPGFDMAQDSFTVTLTRGATSVTYKKSDEDPMDEYEHFVVDSDGNYYVCFSTATFGKGLITATVTAYVPDEDFNDQTRTEIEKFDLLNVVSL